MTPNELLDLCIAQIQEWSEHPVTDDPTVMLVVSRKSAPTGASIRLHGRSGPKGRIANIRETDKGYEIVAYFPAIPIAQEIAAHLGIEIKIVSRESHPDGNASSKEKL